METPFLIIGAGPFGLAMAARAAEQGVEHLQFGRTMSFWTDHMPTGMLLRSGCDWHLDPSGRHTIERFLEERGQLPEDVEPLPLELYLEYTSWFVRQKGIRPDPRRVQRLGQEGSRLRAELDDGGEVIAERVLLALGFAPFVHVPDDLAALLPDGTYRHSVDLGDPGELRGQRVLIIGGRQSAFESAALLVEAGAAAVHVCCRHPLPEFVESDWTWVAPLLERVAGEPSWFRAMPEDERRALDQRFWEEGRRKLEPWLGPRVSHADVALHPETRMVRARSGPGGLDVTLDDGSAIEVDHVLFATGFQVDLARVPMLRDGGLVERIACHEGFPVLDDTLQTSVPGLHMTSLPAVRDFGLFFAFTAAVRASALLVERALGERAPVGRIDPPTRRIDVGDLVLRAWRPEDAPILRAAVDASLDHLRPWIPWATEEPATLAETEQRLRDFEQRFEDGQDYIYGIFDADEREVVGGAGLHRRIGPGGLEIGYWVRVDRVGRGIATAAARALAKLALSCPGVDHVQIRCDPENHASRRIPEKLGFKLVETLRAHTRIGTGELRDTVVYQRTRDDPSAGST